MTTAQTDDELGHARAEVRHLRETVEALRFELEDSGARLGTERRARRGRTGGPAGAGPRRRATRCASDSKPRSSNGTPRCRPRSRSRPTRWRSSRRRSRRLRASLVAARDDANALRDAGERGVPGRTGAAARDHRGAARPAGGGRCRLSPPAARPSPSRRSVCSSRRRCCTCRGPSRRWRPSTRCSPRWSR